MKIKLLDLEYILGYKIKQNSISIGLDLATRTGYCKIQTNTEEAIFTWDFFKFTDNDDIRYTEMVHQFNPVIEKNSHIVIEDTHYTRNPNMFKKLCRFGGIAMTLAELKSQLNVTYNFIGPTSVRSKLKVIIGKAPKGEAKNLVRKWVEERLNIELGNDHDIRDAIVLACAGICEEMDYRSQDAIKESKRKSKKKLKKSKKKVKK